MFLIDRIKTFFSQFHSDATMTFTIVKVIDSHRDWVESVVVHRSSFWSHTDYEFNENINFLFTLYTIRGQEETKYEGVYKLSIIQFMNTYVEVKLYTLNDDSYKYFFIMNDVYKLDVVMNVMDV